MLKPKKKDGCLILVNQGRIHKMTKKIHINQHNLRSNRTKGTNFPVITVKTYKHNYKGNSVEILGPSKLVYSPDKPLQCGARLWVETKAEVKIS